MDKKEARDLLKRYQEGNCSEEEAAWVESWYLRYQQKDRPELSENEKRRSLARVFHRLPGRRPATTVPFIRRAAAAVLVLALLTAGWYLYTRTGSGIIAGEYSQHILPGGNKAVLILPDGNQISLTDASDGVLIDRPGMTITKEEGKQLVYQRKNSGRSVPAAPETITWHTVKTPRGGQYRLVLPDGSNVWLNAASSLKYPADFSGLKERKVILEGEAYFEIAKDPSKPFRVSAREQEVEVLGTHFNIFSYADEPVVRTTLLEGSLRVKATLTADSLQLKPGQQAALSVGPPEGRSAGPSTRLSGGRLSVRNVKAENAIAWKNGLFVFNGNSLEEIMRMVSRWYNVDVEFSQRDLKDDRFSGTVSRFAHVSQVLRKLELTGGVQFDVDDRTIKVSDPGEY